MQKRSQKTPKKQKKKGGGGAAANLHCPLDDSNNRIKHILSMAELN